MHDGRALPWTGSDHRGEFFEIIGNLHRMGRTILLFKQNVRKAFQATDRAYVLELGRVVLEGPSCEVLKSDEVKKAYLG